MTRDELRQLHRIFRQHPGAQAELARVAGVSPTSVSFVLRGKSTSKPLLAAAVRMAEALQKGEAA